jgi:hypothetical protein
MSSLLTRPNAVKRSRRRPRRARLTRAEPPLHRVAQPIPCVVAFMRQPRLARGGVNCSRATAWRFLASRWGSPKAESLASQPAKGHVPHHCHEHRSNEKGNAEPSEAMLRRGRGGAAGSVGDFFWPRDGNRCIHGGHSTELVCDVQQQTFVLVDSSRSAVHEKPAIFAQYVGMR